LLLYLNRLTLFSKEPDGLGLQDIRSVDFICPAQVKSVLFPSASGSDSDARQDLAEVGLGDGRRLRTRLVVRIRRPLISFDLKCKQSCVQWLFQELIGLLMNFLFQRSEIA
jgi:hypothetical protein